MKMLDKALILCSAGNSREKLEHFGLLDSMKKVMLGDRLFGRAKKTEFIVIDNTSRENEHREKNWDKNLQKVYEKGAALFLQRQIRNLSFCTSIIITEKRKEKDIYND